MRGTIERFGSKGYGFILADNGERIYFHARNCLAPKLIKRGAKVKFRRAKDLNGKDMAVNVFVEREKNEKKDIVGGVSNSNV